MNLEDIFNLPASKPEEKKILTPLLEELIRARANETYEPKTEPAFRASGLGTCARQILYQHKGYTRNREPQSQLILEMGTLTHELLQGYIQGAEWGLTSEDVVTVEEIPFTTGHFDYILKINEKKYLLEIKTMNLEAYQRMALYPNPYEKHKKQATFYAEANDLEDVIFMYVNRNLALSADFKKYNPGVHEFFLEIPYKIEEKYKQGNRDYINNILEHFRSGTMPIYEAVSSCLYCDPEIKEHCKADRKLEKKARKIAEKQLELDNQKEN